MQSMDYAPQATSAPISQSKATATMPSVRFMVNDAWKYAKANWALAIWFVGVSLLSLVLFVFTSTFIFSVLFTLNLTGLWLMLPLSIVFTLAAVVLSVLNVGAVLYAVTSVSQISYWQGFTLAWTNKWSLIAMYVLIAVATVGGFVALVVPAVAVGMYLSIAPIVCARESCGPVASLNRSWQLVSGHWWKFFVRLFYVGLGVAFVDFILSYIAEMTGVIGGLVQMLVSAFILVFVLRILVVWYEFFLHKGSAYTSQHNWWLLSVLLLGVLGILLLAVLYLV